MFTRSRISLILVLLASLIFAAPAFAGGWAVITLDEMPSNVVAGEPLTIGFTVLQHGRTPMVGLTPTITANLYKDQEFVVKAEPEGKTGHYTATVTFPKEGEWRWSIQAFTMDQTMPMLSVAAPIAAEVSAPNAAKTEPAPVSASPTVVVSVAVLVLGLVGAVIGIRRRNRLVLGLTALCLVVGTVLLAAGAGTTSEVEAQSKSEADAVKAADAPSLAEVELGKDLFIAKGCITCHYNSRAGSSSEYWTIEMGAPNLSNYSSDPQILFIRLKDPSAAKSDSKMPQLGLKEDEINALIAFINSK